MTKTMYKEEFILTHSLRWSSAMMENAWQQECGASTSSHSLCSQESGRNECWCSAAFLFFPSYSVWTSTHEKMTLTFRVDLFLSINFSGNILTTHAHRFVSEVIQNPGSLTLKISHYIFLCLRFHKSFSESRGQVSSSALVLSIE